MYVFNLVVNKCISLKNTASHDMWRQWEIQLQVIVCSFRLMWDNMIEFIAALLALKTMKITWRTYWRYFWFYRIIRWQILCFDHLKFHLSLHQISRLHDLNFQIGGILVMPLNDKLMQITRKSETEWDSKSVLSVSFSTLQIPQPNDPTSEKLVTMRELFAFPYM